MQILKKKYYEYLIVFVFFASLFYWEVKFLFFEFRFFYLLLVPFFFHDIFRNYIIKKKYNKLFINLVFFIFVIIFYNYYYYNDFTLNNLLLFLIFILSILIVIHFGEMIKKKFDLILDLFLYSFVSLTLIYYAYYSQIFLDNFNIGCSYQGGMFSEKQEVLKEVKRLFLENSHLAMVSVGVIFYYIFTFNFKNNFFNYLKIFYFFIFLLISLHNFSFVFFVGFIISFIAILVSNFSKTHLIKYLIVLLIILFSYNLFIRDNSCENKLSDLKKYTINNIKINNLNDIQDKNYNLSLAVYVQHFDIAVRSLIDYPLGIGLNNYEFAYNKYYSISKKYHHNLRSGQRLNFKDGSNNFFKSIVEFGIFSIVIFLIIFFLCFSKRIPDNIKYFVIPVLLIQTFLRASGYFNGGYLLSLVFFLYLGLRRND
jgi:hypothetical protein